MATSSIPAFKAALAAAIAADANVAADKIQVSYGFPGPSPAREFIWLADVDGEQDWAALGQRSREERFELTLVVRVLREGQDQQAATERAFAIAGYVEQLLQADYTVGGTVRAAGFGGTLKLEELAGDTNRGVLLTIGVQANQRIRP